MKSMKAVCRLKKNSEQGFAGELAVWDLAGFFYGKHFYEPAAAHKAANELGAVASAQEASRT
jgi:hypothetical protein